jgi:hypothetical protein
MMRNSVQLALAALALGSIGGCAQTQPIPDPANPPGAVHFILSGRDDAVNTFQRNLEKIKPNDCQSVLAGESKGDDEHHSEEMVLVYRCANTTPQTFLAFGTAFTQTVGDSQKSAQASLGPVSVAQGSTGLKMTATTSTCLKYWCALLRSYGPWVHNHQCTQRC